MTLFTKVQGLGNDFILIDGRPNGQGEVPFDPARAAVRWCDRHFGIGADGLVILLPGEKVKFRMRIFNPDGSEAEMCGNAIRCMACYLYERGEAGPGAVEIETPAGIIRPELLDGGLVRVDMGEPQLERSKIPMVGPPGRVVNEMLVVDGEVYKVTALSMGNPHCLIFVPDIRRAPVFELGPKIENHNLFPRRTNVEFVQVKDANTVFMRVWERGVGETMACGTGACAVAAGCFLNGFTGRRLKVMLSGGELLLDYNENGRIYMTGPAEIVFSGKIAAPANGEIPPLNF